MRHQFTWPRLTVFAVLALSAGGCSGVLSGDPFKEEVDGAGEKANYTLSQRIMTGFGATSSQDKKKIDYRSRAPLTVPPSMELKAPEDKQDVVAEMPNWPKEVDETDEYIASLEEAKTYREKNRDDWENPAVPGRELARYRVKGGGQQADPKDNRERRGDDAPEVTAAQAKKFKEDIETAQAQEANTAGPRKYLIDPPREYRTPVAGGTLPSKIKVKEKKDAKFSDWDDPTRQ